MRNTFLFFKLIRIASWFSFGQTNTLTSKGNKINPALKEDSYPETKEGSLKIPEPNNIGSSNGSFPDRISVVKAFDLTKVLFTN